MANKGGFSWKTLIGITAAKNKVSKALDVPVFTLNQKATQDRLIGKVVRKLIGGK